MKIIDSSDKTMNDVLAGGFFRIPRFQRPYAWDLENVQEFWDDAIAEAVGPYFIGPVVVYRAGRSTYGIVDGQQRFTTATILLCAVRDALAENDGDDLAAGIHLLIERKDHIDNNQRFVLETETSYPYFHQEIQAYPKPSEREISESPEEDRLRAANKLIRELIGDAVRSVRTDPTVPKKQKPKRIKDKLTGIRDKILDMHIIFVELDNEDDAYLIFETLNARGKELRVSDLVKNHITRMRPAPNAGVDRTKDKWLSVVETLESSSANLSTNTFLHHYWLSQNDYVSEKKLFRAIRQSVRKETVDAFLNSLVKDSKTYRKAFEPRAGHWTKQEVAIRRSLEALSVVFHVQQPAPFILSLLRCYRDGQVKLKLVKEALRAVESFHFLFTAIASKSSSGGMSKMYASHARDLAVAADNNARVLAVRGLIQKLRERLPSEQEVEAGFAGLRYSDTHTKDRALVGYAMRELCRLDYKATGISIDDGAMTLEHLFPQKPPTSVTPIDEELVASIGNLIPVSEHLNNELENKAFKDKIVLLKAEL